LQVWRHETAYAGDEDFVFASARPHGTQPHLGGIAQDYLRVHAVKLGIITEDSPRFGFHNYRHSLATFLVESNCDPVVVQKMLRQSNVDIPMIYIHNAKKAREAQGQFMKRFVLSGVQSGVSQTTTAALD